MAGRHARGVLLALGAISLLGGRTVGRVRPMPTDIASTGALERKVPNDFGRADQRTADEVRGHLSIAAVIQSGRDHGCYGRELRVDECAA